MSFIDDAHVNGWVDYYNNELGLALPHATETTIVTNEFYIDLVNNVNAACATQGRISPFASFNLGTLVDGAIIHDFLEGATVGTIPAPPRQTILVTDSAYTYTVPVGVNQILVTWVQGGGGAGGYGNEGGNGGGGGGGQSGAFWRYQEMAVAPGDVLSFAIGQGGAQFIGTAGQHANSGGDSVLYKNGVEMYRAAGGQGGQNYTNTQGGQGGYIAQPGAGGDTPTNVPGYYNGAGGVAGQTGTGDKSSSAGGPGGSSTVAGAAGGLGGTGFAGGDPYTGGSAGKPGAGYGSAGGGAGTWDRHGNLWAGGAGNAGFIEFVTPTPGTPYAPWGTPIKEDFSIYQWDLSGWTFEDGTNASYPGKQFLYIGQNGPVPSIDVTSPLFYVSAGSSLTATYKVMIGNLVQGGMIAYYHWYDAGGNFVGDSTVHFSPNNNIQNYSQALQNVFTVTVPAGVVRAMMVISSSSDAAFSNNPGDGVYMLFGDLVLNSQIILH